MEFRRVLFRSLVADRRTSGVGGPPATRRSASSPACPARGNPSVGDPATSYPDRDDTRVSGGLRTRVPRDRKSGGEGKRVDLGGRRINKKKKKRMWSWHPASINQSSGGVKNKIL